MSTFAFVRAVIGAVLASGVTAAHADSITIDQAVSRAARRVSVAIAGADVEAARQEADGSRRPIYNPELGVAIGPRFGGGKTLLDVEVSLAQTIELGGKRGARRAAGDARVAVAEAELARATYAAEIDVWRAFQRGVVARARLEGTRATEALAAQLVAATNDRQTLGAGTQLQINLATLEVARARHDRFDAENDYDAALAELATAVGAAPEERLEPAGDLPELPAATWDEEALVLRALADRPDLEAARAQLTAARADVRLADALGRPDVTASLSYGFEQDVDTDFHAVLAGLSISLPVRNRNQGQRAATRARSRRAEIELVGRLSEAERELRTAVRAYVRARDAVLGFDREINQRLQDNLELARASFEAGKLDYFEFTVVRRELVANQLAYLDAVNEAIDAWTAVQRAAGKEGAR
ncbi:MAG: TolC family protein [Myxococcales bacterium]|nr:TolC family protein [Myxococcales bacterium]